MLAAMPRANGTIELFYTGLDSTHTIYQAYQDKAGGAFRDRDEIPGRANQLTIMKNAQGLAQMFYIGRGDAIYSMWEQAEHSWRLPHERYGNFDARCLTLAPNADGRLELLWADKDLKMWHGWQTPPNNVWQAPRRFPGLAKSMAAALRADGRLTLL